MGKIREYDVFKLADELVLRVYGATGGFPKDELYGLTSQMRRAPYSIPMNLVEGAARDGEKEFLHFLHFVSIALGSCEEVRDQLHLTCRLDYLPAEDHENMERDFGEVKKMLTALSKRIRSSPEAEGGRRLAVSIPKES